MDIYGVIKDDHDKARQLLDALDETKDTEGQRRARRFADLKIELMMHQHVEESVFYNTLKEIDETRDDALEAISEHHVVDTLLEELDDMPKEGDEWRAKFGVLKELVEHHMREEEDEFFANARKALDDEQADRMGAVFREKKTAGVKAMSPVDMA
jgi:hemerythrin HHE cation binding domain-containing protein